MDFIRRTIINCRVYYSIVGAILGVIYIVGQRHSVVGGTTPPTIFTNDYELSSLSQTDDGLLDGDNVTFDEVTTEPEQRATTSLELESVSDTDSPAAAISLVEVDSSTLLLSWNPLPDAVEYYIRYHPKTEAAQSLELHHVFAPANTVRLKELEPNTIYVIEVEAKTTLSSIVSVGLTEVQTLSENVSAYAVNVALIYVVCILAAIVIILLIMMFVLNCWLFCRPRPRAPPANDEVANGQVTRDKKSFTYELEHHNPGYTPNDDDDEDDGIGGSETSRAYIYMSPENSPV